MFFYDHHIGDFRAATAFLTPDLQYAYLKLLWVYYDTEEPLPNDPKKLALKAGTNQDQVTMLLSEFFDLNGDQWHHARCDKELDTYRRHQVGSSKGGKKRAANAAAKKKRALKEPSTDVQPPLKQPVTSNHEPVTKEKDTTLSSPAGPTKAPGKISVQIPVQAIVDAWNTQSAAHGMVQCIKITKALRGQIQQRWADLDTMKKWNNFFDHIGMNDFLAGRAPAGPGRSKPFRSSLLWVTKETNFAKIAQGEYD